MWMDGQRGMKGNMTWPKFLVVSVSQRQEMQKKIQHTSNFI